MRGKKGLGKAEDRLVLSKQTDCGDVVAPGRYGLAKKKKHGRPQRKCVRWGWGSKVPQGGKGKRCNIWAEATIFRQRKGLGGGGQGQANASKLGGRSTGKEVKKSVLGGGVGAKPRRRLGKTCQTGTDPSEKGH